MSYWADGAQWFHAGRSAEVCWGSFIGKFVLIATRYNAEHLICLLFIETDLDPRAIG